MTASSMPDRARHWAKVAADLSARMPDSRLRPGGSLGALSTYRVGGNAGVVAEVGSRSDLVALASRVADEGWKVLVVGLGSNLLVADAGFDGVALRLGSAFANVAIEAPHVIAGGAAALPTVARRAAAAGLGGFGWAVGVPGSIGGAVRMNAGGHGSDMSAVLRSAEVVDLATGAHRGVSVEQLKLGYRTSALHMHEVVVEVDLSLDMSDRDQEGRTIAEVVAWRRSNQPGGANTGSVFVNPPGDSAGRLAEAAGCKGLRIGSAAVSTRHANFIQADPSGSADDVMRLMAEVARRVECDSGIRLQPETQLVGFGDDVWSVCSEHLRRSP